MSQNLKEVKTTDYIDEGLNSLLDRDNCALTCLYGETSPENAVDNIFYNNATDKNFYTLKDGNWLKVLYYKRPYFNEAYLQKNYQPLNENLTLFSNQTPIDNSFIAYDKVVSFTSYFRDLLLNGASKDSVSSSIKMGEVSKLNSIPNTYIKENSITAEKLANPLATTPQFYPGDVCMSFNKNGKSNFIKLAVGVTVGNNSSGATYVGVKFKDLFLALWKNTTLQIQNLRGVVTTRGESAEVDWNTGCRMCLPDVYDKYGNKVGYKIFESTSGSKTFSVTVPGYYYVTLVGGGGGGWGFERNYSKWWRGASAGGSGATFSGYVYFPVGTYEIVVGAAGVSDATADDRWSKSTAGGDSYISGVITAGGGGPGKGAGRDTSWGAGYSAGTGGTLTYHNPSKHPVSTTILAVNGNPGAGTGCGSQWGGTFAGGASTSTPLGITYGQGSTASSSPSATTPGGGYASVGYMGYYPPANSKNENNINDQKFMQDLVFYMKY